MFTGLIQDVGRVRTIEKGGDWRIVIQTAFDMDAHDIGASIACSGCCLTVVAKGEGWFAVDVSQESLSKTNLGTWEEGTFVNLEPSLKLDDELGGHIVSGHVDGLAQLVGLQKEGDSHRLTFEVPSAFAGYIASKGSVALDGISLTINEVRDNQFGVNIIPHTWDVTSFQAIKVGDAVNFEVDMLARYVARQMEVRA